MSSPLVAPHTGLQEGVALDIERAVGACCALDEVVLLDLVVVCLGECRGGRGEEEKPDEEDHRAEEEEAGEESAAPKARHDGGRATSKRPPNISCMLGNIPSAKHHHTPAQTQLTSAAPLFNVQLKLFRILAFPVGLAYQQFDNRHVSRRPLSGYSTIAFYYSNADTVHAWSMRSGYSTVTAYLPCYL